MSAGQLYQNVWKNPPADIPKDTEREPNKYSRIVNPQRFYEIVYRETFINHEYLLYSFQFENKMERVKSVDAWINELKHKILVEILPVTNHHIMTITKKLATYWYAYCQQITIKVRGICD